MRKGEAPTTPYQYTLNHHGWSATHTSNSGSTAYSHPDHPGHTVFASHEHGWAHSQPGAGFTGSHAHGKDAPSLHEHLTAFHSSRKSMAKGASMNLFKKAGIGWQSSPLTPLQKSFAAPGERDGAKVLEPLTVIDELKKSDDPDKTFVVWANKADLREALLEAEQRGDPQVRRLDVGLVDKGFIRKALAAHLFPNHNFNRDDDGEIVDESIGRPMVKSGAENVARDAFGAYSRNPGANLTEAAAELDALVESLRRHNG
jgi:hypothetical protein